MRHSSESILLPHDNGKSLKLTTVSDDTFLPGLVITINGLRLDLPDDFHAFNDLAEHNVLVVEPSGLDSANEELRSIGVGASIGHAEDARAGMLELEVLILELTAVDGLATSAIAGSEITTLDHEILDHSVEGTSFEMEGLA